MTPFESAVRGSLEGSHGGRAHVRDDHGQGYRATPLSGTQLPTDLPSWMLGDVPHTHRAIDDAVGYANLLVNLLGKWTERTSQ